MKRQMRFRRAGGIWTRWYDFDEDLSFLKNNFAIEAVEVSEEMTRDEFAKSFPDMAARL